VAPASLPATSDGPQDRGDTIAAEHWEIPMSHPAARTAARISAVLLGLALGLGAVAGTASAETSQEQLLSATKQMQETQMSFNLQYLQLQSQMQAANRSYTAVSTIMKTKHDTVQNSLANLR
jgi:hypothetical protein